MRIAQTTAACRHLYTGRDGSLDIAARYAALGYTAVDFSFMDAAKRDSVCSLRQENWQNWAERAKEKLDIKHIFAVQSHAPIFNPLSMEGAGDEEKTEMTKRSLAASGIMGIPWVVIHPGTDYLDNRFSRNLEKNKEFFKPLLEFAEKYQTGIAIENMFDTYHHPYGVKGSGETENRRVDHHLISQRRFGTNPEELLELVEKLSVDFPNVGICWDFGHANEAGINQAECLKNLGKRIKAIHVNDNMAVFDEHMIPFSGSVPWEEVMICLQQIGYEGDFVYENTKFFNRLPESLINAALRYSLEVARYLIGLCEP